MDRAQSDLSLGFGSSHALPLPPTQRIPIADDSITLQIDSSFRPSSNPMPPVPLQLLEQRFDDTGSRSRVVEEDDDVAHDDDDDDDDDDQREEEQFILLGHPMKLKRCRGTSSISSPSPCKRFAVDSGIESRRAAVRAWGNQSIEEADPEIHEFMEKEKQRQFRGIELIASENFVCRAVMEALGSHLTNKYSEGMPGARYYTGNQYIDQIEILCQERALAAFGLDHEKWGVNVQPYSCTSANFAVFSGLLTPGERIMGLDSPSGGHMSHGYYTPGGKKVSGASIFFESFPYKVDPRTGIIDYNKLEEKALDYRPKILICGGSSYPRDWEFPRFKHIADKCGAVLMFDMAQISGLVAAKEAPNPFDYCDIVTSTTHKSLRGPRGGIIFYRKGLKLKKQSLNLNNHCESNIQYDFEEKINFSVFPSLQGGPHNNHIAALAIALKQAASPEYKVYMRQVRRNAKALEHALSNKKCKLVTGGTDNHLLLWDLTPLGLTGKVYEKVCEMCHITVNKVAIFSLKRCDIPWRSENSPAMTSRGCLESDFETMAEFLYRAAQIASAAQREHGKLQKEPLKSIYHCKDIADLRNQVEAFASQFAMPAFDI